jgi:hypothetical protein
MKKTLFEFIGGSKGDLLLAHFTKSNKVESYGKTAISGNDILRKNEFLKKLNQDYNYDIDNKTDLIEQILNSDEMFISVHNLNSVIEESQINLLADKVNIIQLYVEEEFRKQVYIDCTIKVLCKELSNYEKIVYKNILYKQFSKNAKKIAIKYKIDMAVLEAGIELTDENRVKILVDDLNNNTYGEEYFNLKQYSNFIINYSELFFKPYKDYFLLCDFLNVKPDIDDFSSRVKNSFIPNPLCFSGKEINLTQFGYQYYN